MVSTLSFEYERFNLSRHPGFIGRVRPDTFCREVDVDKIGEVIRKR